MNEVRTNSNVQVRKVLQVRKKPKYTNFVFEDEKMGLLIGSIKIMQDLRQI